MMKRREFAGALAVSALGAIAVNSQSRQMAQTAPVLERQRVFPQRVIEANRLRPVTGSLVPYILGEDGQPYALDDVLRIIFVKLWG